MQIMRFDSMLCAAFFFLHLLHTDRSSIYGKITVSRVYFAISEYKKEPTTTSEKSKNTTNETEQTKKWNEKYKMHCGYFEWLFNVCAISFLFLSWCWAIYNQTTIEIALACIRSVGWLTGRFQWVNLFDEISNQLSNKWVCVCMYKYCKVMSNNFDWLSIIWKIAAGT